MNENLLNICKQTTIGYLNEILVPYFNNQSSLISTAEFCKNLRVKINSAIGDPEIISQNDQDINAFINNDARKAYLYYTGKDMKIIVSGASKEFLDMMINAFKTTGNIESETDYLNSNYEYIESTITIPVFEITAFRTYIDNTNSANYSSYIKITKEPTIIIEQKTKEFYDQSCKAWLSNYVELSQYDYESNCFDHVKEELLKNYSETLIENTTFSNKLLSETEGYYKSYQLLVKANPQNSETTPPTENQDRTLDISTQAGLYYESAIALYKKDSSLEKDKEEFITECEESIIGFFSGQQLTGSEIDLITRVSTQQYEIYKSEIELIKENSSSGSEGDNAGSEGGNTGSDDNNNETNTGGKTFDKNEVSKLADEFSNSAVDNYKKDSSLEKNEEDFVYECEDYIIAQYLDRNLSNNDLNLINQIVKSKYLIYKHTIDNLKNSSSSGDNAGSSGSGNSGSGSTDSDDNKKWNEIQECVNKIAEDFVSSNKTVKHTKASFATNLKNKIDADSALKEKLKQASQTIKNKYTQYTTIPADFK